MSNTKVISDHKVPWGGCVVISGLCTKCGDYFDNKGILITGKNIEDKFDHGCLFKMIMNSEKNKDIIEGRIIKWIDKDIK